MRNWKIIITLHYVFYLNFDSVDRRMPRARKFFFAQKRRNERDIEWKFTSLRMNAKCVAVHVWNASMHPFVKMYVKIIFYRIDVCMWCDVMYFTADADACLSIETKRNECSNECAAVLTFNCSRALTLSPPFSFLQYDAVLKCRSNSHLLKQRINLLGKPAIMQRWWSCNHKVHARE